jgi:cytidylate kinase
MSNAQELIDKRIQRWEEERLRMLLQPEGNEPSVSPLRRPALALSRELGSGSRLVAEELHIRTGFEIFGSALIKEIAENIQVSRQLIDRLDERARSRVTTLFESFFWGESQVKQADYFRSLAQVIGALIEQGSVILLGRGAHFLLPEKMGLRIRLIAPLERRIQNITKYYHIDSDAALERIQNSDRQRTEFARTYFNKELDHPADYDLVLNMGSLSTHTAANIIVNALEAQESRAPESPDIFPETD